MDTHQNPELPPRTSPVDSGADVWQLLSLPERNLPSSAVAMQHYLMHTISQSFPGFRGDWPSSHDSGGLPRIVRADQEIFNRIEDYLTELFSEVAANSGYKIEPLEFCARCTFINAEGERRYLAMVSAFDTEGNSIILNSKGDGLSRYNNFVAVLVETGSSVREGFRISFAYSQPAFEEAIIEVCAQWREHFSLANSFSIPLLDQICDKVNSFGFDLHGRNMPDSLSCFEGTEGSRFFRISSDGDTLLVSVDRDPVNCSPRVEVFRYIPGFHLISLTPLIIGNTEQGALKLVRESFITEEKGQVFCQAAQALSNQYLPLFQGHSYSENQVIHHWLNKSQIENKLDIFDTIDRLDIRSVSRRTMFGAEHATILLFAKDNQQRYVLHTPRTHAAYDWGAVAVVLKSINGEFREAHPVYSPEAFAEEIGRSMIIRPEEVSLLRKQSYILDLVISTISKNPYATNMIKDFAVELATDHATFLLQLAWEIITVEVKRDCSTGIISLRENGEYWS